MSDTPSLHHPAYKARLSDGSEKFIEIEKFKRALFSKQEYLADGQGYLSIHQLIFEAPLGEIIGGIEHERALKAHEAALRNAKAVATVAADLGKLREERRASIAA